MLNTIDQCRRNANLSTAIIKMTEHKNMNQHFSISRREKSRDEQYFRGEIIKYNASSW